MLKPGAKNVRFTEEQLQFIYDTLIEQHQDIDAQLHNLGIMQPYLANKELYSEEIKELLEKHDKNSDLRVMFEDKIIL